ncbi:MAG TPA: NAD-dependent DNA ligase LigA, partial [Candidatus Limnocylindria bacterium]|nr:NAD-dependent DNA ligase LigA [Candidatus Limnocylindria bacterium]
MDAPARMQELVRILNEANQRYYVLDDPMMPDAQWDALYDELLALEAESGVRLADSPSSRVGGDPLAAFVPHRHLNRLWSLDKVRSEEGLRAWFARTRAAYKKLFGLPPLSYTVEYKYDGLTLNLTYEGGTLRQAATRGNGVVGEEVLPQAMTVRGIPISIPYQGLLEIHGECFMRLSVLARYNREAPEALKNARNAAAGALRNLDPKETAKRRLDARFYAVGTIEDAPYADQAGLFQFIRENGFPASPLLYAGEDEEGVLEAIRKVEEERDNIDFLIDGAVVKVGDLRTREALGYTDKFPRGAIAFKFTAEEAVATLLRVTWEPGRSGKLTPTAHLSPVDIAGVTVQRATLNNYGDILRKGVEVGAAVRLRRSNDVIPEILGKVDGGGPGEAIPKPDRCPACGAELSEIGANLFCLNRDCEPQVIARLAHFCSRDAMDIEGLSDKTLMVLYERLGVREPHHLYPLKPEILAGLPGFAKKKAENLTAAIAASRVRPLDAYLYALGIPGVGRATAGDLARAFGSLEAVRAASEEELALVPGVGGETASSITAFFRDPQSRAMVDGLLEAGVAPAAIKKAAAKGKLAGQSVVITGTLSTLTRREAEERIT